MPTETEEPRTEEPQFDYHHEHFEGGPVKTFLEHLEDLRWVLIKSLAAIAVGFIVCVLAGPQVIAVLKYPLDHAKLKHPKGYKFLSFYVGTNRFGSFRFGETEKTPFNFGTNSALAFQFTPITNGDKVFLGLEVDPTATKNEERLVLPLINLGPASGFIVATKVAVYAGLLMASPFIFYVVAMFVFPALKMREKKYAYRGMLFGGGLFLIGVSFCYFVLMPIALSASVQFSEWLGFTAEQWRADEYISFVCKFMLGMGLGFELPVVILILVKLGVLTYSMLSRGRRYMIVISFILGAVLTTPEVVTQVLMAIPLLLLYEATIWIAWYWERQDRQRAMAAA